MLDYEALIKNPSVQSFLVDTITEEGLVLIELLINKDEYTSEFVLAEKSGIYVNTVRKLLYRLYEHKIVSYSRKREKTRGWYIYSWRFHLKKLLLRIMKLKQEQVLKLKASLIPATSNQFFYCKDCDLKIDFVVAMENNFMCPSCEKPMIVYAPEAVNKRIKLDMKGLKDELLGLQDLWVKAIKRKPKEVKEEVKPKKAVKKIKPEKAVKKPKPVKKAVKKKPKPSKKKSKPKPKPKKVVKKKPKSVAKKPRPKPKPKEKPKKKSFWSRIRGK